MMKVDMHRRSFFTADRPDGPMHIGHYAGALRNRLSYQGRYEQHIMIGDYLALADNIDNPSVIVDNVMQVALDNLAIGIDPELSTIFIQSHVMELTALTTIYQNLVSAGYLLANPPRSTEVARRGFSAHATAGTFTHPVSQVADITAFDADTVPVGTSQIPLVEFSAMLVRGFNDKFGRSSGPVLVEPAPLVASAGRLPGIDGHPKMGKSPNNAIYFSDSEDVVSEKVRRIAMTPPRSASDPATSPPFAYLREFHPDPAEVNQIKERYRSGQIGAATVREILLDVIQEFLGPIRKRRQELDADRGEVVRILQAGSERAARKAAITLDRVKAATGLRISAFTPCVSQAA